MNGTAMTLTPDQIAAKREEKLQTRRYFTVSLSDRLVPGGKPFRCWECGNIVQTVYNEPKAQVEVKIAMEDVTGKLMGSLCRKDNIMFLFT
jgi:hypothetical protein